MTVGALALLLSACGQASADDPNGAIEAVEGVIDAVALEDAESFNEHTGSADPSCYFIYATLHGIHPGTTLEDATATLSSEGLAHVVADVDVDGTIFFNHLEFDVEFVGGRWRVITDC